MDDWMDDGMDDSSGRFRGCFTPPAQNASYIDSSLAPNPKFLRSLTQWYINSSKMIL